MRIALSEEEIRILFAQAPETKPDGGFQRLLVSLQEKFDRESSSIELTDAQVGRITKYAFNFGRGGFEARLQKIFGRALRPRLRQERSSSRRRSFKPKGGCK